MAYFRTTASYGSTGTKTIVCGFQPEAMRVTLGSEASSTDPCNHLSIGNTNGTSSSYHSTYSDASGHQTKSGTGGKIVSHYKRVSGTLTEKVSARVDSVAAPWTATEVKFIVDTADANFQFHVEVWG